ncbi:phytoene desaturase family protein [Kitasatospora sp. NPDC059673]|uniref:phytoene desaturase family protein n=1 Tax=Kitasatospora sp. NPDC059673 TaxID=3346901 RepID=UPI0036C737B5
MTVAYDVVIVGGGHNGLVAAGYLGRAGFRVLVLERLGHVGGAAVSERAFPGVDARLSRYSYLVSLLPRRIVTDLGVRVELRRRRISSYTPWERDGRTGGLLVDASEERRTAESFRELTGGECEFTAWREFYGMTGRVARRVFPSLTEPLPSRAELRALVDDPVAWAELFERPLGEALERRFADDVVRGVVLTDALIGTFTHAHDPSLRQNRCFLYHVIGGGTGDWDVPVGGMGAVTGALAEVARAGGAEFRTGCEVVAVDPGGRGRPAEVGYLDADGVERRVGARWVLCNAAPVELARLLGASGGASGGVGAAGAGAGGAGAWAGTGAGAGAGGAGAWAGTGAGGLAGGAEAGVGGAGAGRAGVGEAGVGEGAPEGAQLKVNMLLRRLPRLRDEAVDVRDAFGGTFHVAESYRELENAYRVAEAGQIPSPAPSEIYCHSLADRSILGPDVPAGWHTLTLFGLQLPARLFAGPGDPEGLRQAALAGVLAALDGVLAEPLAECLAVDGDGRPCLEVRSPLDLEADLRLPGGNIFHRDLAFPFREEGGVGGGGRGAGVPVADSGRWGVETAEARVLLCGAGAVRGGGVSGIPGHNAAMAVLGR